VGPTARAEIDAFIRAQAHESKRGSKGSRSSAPSQDVSHVREAQTLLTKLGYDPGPADGSVGPKTRAAVAAFQESRGLLADGRVSAALIRELEMALERTTKREPPSPPTQPVLREVDEDWEDLD
jgi:peptidoglycan hydrolase-like protein with peptidoglycan-binding domain